jgi:imidazolonepropionase-like amidohydrolase
MRFVQKRCLVPGLLGIVGALLLGIRPSLHGEAPARPPTLALVGGRILTQTDAGPVAGTVLIRDGKIAAVGPAVAVPADAKRIDVAGLVVTPGLIDARSTLWLTAAAAREGAGDGGLDVLDGIDPHEEDWKEVIRQGVTAVYVQPANSGLLGGRGAVLRVGPAETVEELVVKAGAAAQAALGTAAGGSTPAAQPAFPRRFGADPPATGPDQPATVPAGSGNSLARFGQYEQLKRALEAVKQYDNEWKKAEKSAKKPRRDGAKDFLRQALNREVPVRIEAHREDDVQSALRLADEFRLRVVLDGVSNPRGAAETIVSRRVPLVLGPFAELEDVPGYRRGRPTDWPKALLAPDVRWALGTFSTQPRGSRLLRVQAAAAVARGIDPDHVLRAMTRDAADILGVGDRLGTIAPGKQADLAVFAGDPLDPSVPVRLVLSRGQVVYQAAAAPASAAARATGALPLPARLPKQYALRTHRLFLEDCTFRPGMVLVDNGKVAAVGPAVTLSDETPTYDLGSAVLSPGLVAGHSDLGLAGAIDDPAEADAGQVRAADVYDPQHRPVRALLAGGFTSALFSPGSANVIAGGAAAVRLGAPGPLPGNAGIKFVLAASSRETDPSPTPVAGGRLGRLGGRSEGPARYPGSLAGQVELVEQVLGGKAPETGLYLPRRVREQIDAERRRQVAALLDRKQVALFEAHTRAEVDAALQLIARFKLRGVLVGPEEIKPFLGEIKRLGVGIVARPTQPGDYDRPSLELAEAAAAGVPVAFGSTSAQGLRITAALAVNAGMPGAAAWRGLTTAAGQMTGLPASVGRLVPGGPADLVVWDGSPLDLRSRPLRVVVGGKVVYAGP